MNAPTPQSHHAAPNDLAAQLIQMVEQSAHLLPTQGPIGVFVHHNTLHAFQHLPFDQAVAQSARLFGRQPYLSEAAFRSELRSGRILPEDIDAVLDQEPDATILPGRLTSRQLRRQLLLHGPREYAPTTLSWLLEEDGWLNHFRSDLQPSAKKALSADHPRSLWQACLDCTSAPTPLPAAVKRPRDAIYQASGVDMDEIVHPVLIRLCGSFLDQGIAYWPMPFRELGLLRAARKLLLSRFIVYPTGLEGLDVILKDQENRDLDAIQVTLELLPCLDVPPDDWPHVIQAKLHALPGWAGLIHLLEHQPELAPHERLPCSLLDLLALRLTLEAAIVINVARDFNHATSCPPPPASDQLSLFAAAAPLFEVAQLVGLSSSALRAMSPSELSALMSAINQCGSIERRRLLHAAYERRHERQILLPLIKHRTLPMLTPPSGRLAAQVFFCIDEREESLRRHLEEVNPDIETYGAAGFFGVAVDYRGLDDAKGVSLCPVVMKPNHAVSEQPIAEEAHLLSKRRSLRKFWSVLGRHHFISSRTLIRGWLSTATLGFFSLFPLTLRVLSPLHYSKWMKALNHRFLPKPRTELTFMRDDAEGRSATAGLLQGFSLDEKADRVASVLTAAGLRKGLARLVLILGHGSTSLNNPYESAYCCGACGGYSGGPNARLFANMANHPEVRIRLRLRGISVPEDTWFLGGYHDTCSDDIDLFDLDHLPSTHQSDLKRLQTSLHQARSRNAHERTRRFELSPWLTNPTQALRHVQERSEHLAEPRPEYGHCTNAVAIVGRRCVTRGLFLDRRSFLVSYDAHQDPQDLALTKLLAAVIPVCAGINLEYYFSTVDNVGYGSGTKLPHNITGLVGVMNGYQGDLLTGLPLQTVEIHEPVRILFIVETTPDRLMRVIRSNTELNEMVENRWLRLASLDPNTGEVKVYRDHDQFERIEPDQEPLPVITSSRAWYQHKRQNLPLARIDPHSKTQINTSFEA